MLVEALGTEFETSVLSTTMAFVGFKNVSRTFSVTRVGYRMENLIKA